MVPVTAGVLLAAGRGARMGGLQKGLLVWEGKALVRWAAEALLSAGLSPVVVVVGEGAEEPVRRELRGLAAAVVTNPRAAEGMGTSLAAGVAALGAQVGTVAVALADMPRLRGETVARLWRAFLGTERGIVVPRFRGQRGHPVLFDLGRYRGELLALGGDRGARELLRVRETDVLSVEVDDPGVILDVDTAVQWQALTGTEGRGRELLGRQEQGAGGHLPGAKRPGENPAGEE